MQLVLLVHMLLFTTGMTRISGVSNRVTPEIWWCAVSYNIVIKVLHSSCFKHPTIPPFSLYCLRCDLGTKILYRSYIRGLTLWRLVGSFTSLPLCPLVVSSAGICRVSNWLVPGRCCPRSLYRFCSGSSFSVSASLTAHYSAASPLPRWSRPGTPPPPPGFRPAR